MKLLGPFLGPFLNNVGSFLEHFSVMLVSGVHLGVPCRPLGPSWDPHQILIQFLTKSRKKIVEVGIHFGTMLRMLTYFKAIFIMSNFLINFGRDLGGAMWTTCCK